MEQLQLRPHVSPFVSPDESRPGIDASITLFLGVRSTQEGLEIVLLPSGLQSQEFTTGGGHLYGPFRSGARLLNAHSALLRWFWALLLDNANWPGCLYRKRAPRSVLIPWPPELGSNRRRLALLHLDLCLSGLRALPEIVLPHEEPDLFLQKLWLDDQITLASFFTQCCSRRDQLRRLMRLKPTAQRPRRSQRIKLGSKKSQTRQHCFPNIILKSKRR